MKMHAEFTMYANARDGKPWTSQDLADLKHSIEAGQSIAATATFLSREGTVGDVVKTAKAHGWQFDELGPNRRRRARRRRQSGSSSAQRSRPGTGTQNPSRS